MSFHTHVRYYFREDAEGNLIFFPRSYRGPGYIVPPEERERVRSEFATAGLTGAGLLFVWMLLALPAALLLGWGRLGFLLLLLVPVPPVLKVTLRRYDELKRRVEKWPVSDTRFSFQEHLALGLKDSHFGIWLFIVGGGVSALSSSWLLIQALLTRDDPKEIGLAVVMLAGSVPSSLTAVYCRACVARGRRQGWFDEDD